MNAGLQVDTNIVSFLLKKDTRAERFKPLLRGKILYLSFVSVAELYRWALSRNWGHGRIARLEKTFKSYVVLPYDRDLAWTWARVMDACSRQGLNIPATDAWIAATACRHDLPLLTHNVQDFVAAEEYCGLRLLTVEDPVEAP